MIDSPRRRRAPVLLAAFLVALSAGCAGGAPPRSEPGAGPGAGHAAPRAAATARASGAEVLRQTPEEVARTAASLRVLDERHPLYSITYHGGYDLEAPLEDADLADRSRARSWACSLFVAAGDRERPMFGRNFDWRDRPAILVRADPPDGYASMSLMDVGYLLPDGMGRADLSDPVVRRRLAHGVLAPFDGVNEKGLAIGMAAVPGDSRPSPRPGKVTVGGERVIRIVLDRAATVDEAIALMRRYDLDFGGGPRIHYLIADATGRSAVVEYIDGETRVIEPENRWQTLTNTLQYGRPASAQDDRFHRAEARLSATSGVLDWRGSMDLLENLAQGHTRWSVVYDLRGGPARLVLGKRYGEVREIPLREPAA
ncbi:linear amide C-N hydrolase [Bailinhaonella thermotolerans]|uniref:Linear amide C-N hydrolase n=1 Tax=Bailinhaonella thermotolerans TaxID=1070861 RepID=A0A3A4BWT6_9ACTN|nr:linear amide C-N hydrolase [Bailinhaonella thermotolerans]RJL36048.1 linear amide C-N hydrolase [Bailinhaonella thermotolerans]